MGGVCSLAAQRGMSLRDAGSLARGVNDRSIGTATLRWSSDKDFDLFVSSWGGRLDTDQLCWCWWKKNSGFSM